MIGTHWTHQSVPKRYSGRPGYWVDVSAENPKRDELVGGLVRVGELELSGENEASVDSYFAPDFAFHGPDGAESDYEGLKRYFASLRAAFDDLTISRGIMIVEGDYVACQTKIEGTFVREFTHSPVGTLPPNGRRVAFELMNMFRFDDQGRLAEEWVQTDNRSRLRQLGAEGR
jgi:predicted ester cyclase